MRLIFWSVVITVIAAGTSANAVSVTPPHFYGQGDMGNSYEDCLENFVDDPAFCCAMFPDTCPETKCGHLGDFPTCGGACPQGEICRQNDPTNFLPPSAPRYCLCMPGGVPWNFN